MKVMEHTRGWTKAHKGQTIYMQHRGVIEHNEKGKTYIKKKQDEMIRKTQKTKLLVCTETIRT